MSDMGQQGPRHLPASRRPQGPPTRKSSASRRTNRLELDRGRKRPPSRRVSRHLIMVPCSNVSFPGLNLESASILASIPLRLRLCEPPQRSPQYRQDLRLAILGSRAISSSDIQSRLRQRDSNNSSSS